jgi:hypothetical protein
MSLRRFVWLDLANHNEMGIYDGYLRIFVIGHFKAPVGRGLLRTHTHHKVETQCHCSRVFLYVLVGASITCLGLCGRLICLTNQVQNAASIIHN